MNNLSWFLYFADVLPALGSTVVFFGLAILIFGGFGLLVWVVGLAVAPKETVDIPKILPRTYFGVVFFTLLAALIPSKETIYLIAGSEAGEAVVTSPQGQEIISDIHEVIKQQLEGLKDDE